jgi:CspA family cold shock protein
MADYEIGVVKWFDTAKGYGFIQTNDGADVFVHYKNILGDGYRSLKQGQQVKFIVKNGPKGLQAEEVTKVEEDEEGA